MKSNNIIVSPHIDDALLSMGGIIINFTKSQIPVDIKYIFTISNWINPEAIGYEQGKGKLETDIVTALRKREEENISQCLHYTYECFDFLDKPLRNIEDKGKEEELANDIKKRIKSSAKINDNLFFPIGLGHSDHVIIRNIGYELLMEGYNIIFYEDLPYVTWNRGHYENLRSKLTSSDYVHHNARIEIQEKLDALRLYSSQVSVDWLKEIEKFCYSESDGKFYERLWHNKNYSFNAS